MPQTYKMRKRDKEEQGEHSFFFFFFFSQGSFRLEGTVCSMHYLSVCIQKVHRHTLLTSRHPAVPVQTKSIRYFRQSFLYIWNPHPMHISPKMTCFTHTHTHTMHSMLIDKSIYMNQLMNFYKLFFKLGFS